MAENNTNIVSALNAGSGINIKELAQALVDAEKFREKVLCNLKSIRVLQRFRVWVS